MVLEKSRLILMIVWEKMMSKKCVPTIRFKSFFNHWSNTGLKEVKDVRDGTHSSPKYIDTGYPLVTSKNLTDSGLNLEDVSLISDSDYNEINKRSKVEVGDILLGLIGTIGKPVLVETDGFAIKNVGLIKNGGQIQNQFLLQYLKTNLFNKYIQIEMAGNTQKFLGLETLRNTKIPVPSSAEQSAIGSLFRIIDELLASYKDNLANYQSLKATMFSKMFTKAGQTVPEIRLDGFEGEWELCEINDLADDFQSGGTPKTNVQEYWDGDIPWIQSSDLGINCLFEIKVQKSISEKGLENSSAKIIPKDSIAVVTRVGVGKLAVMRHEYATSQDFLSLSNLKSNIEFTAYLLYRLLQKEVTQLQGTSIKGITKGELLSKKVFIPSVPEQQAIGAYFSNLDNLINSHQEKISQLETLKKKLLQDMFI